MACRKLEGGSSAPNHHGEFCPDQRGLPGRGIALVADVCGGHGLVLVIFPPGNGERKYPIAGQWEHEALLLRGTGCLAVV